jgi:DNA polymerase, archaea type
MSYNHRNFITRVGNKIIVDENKLDIFWEDTNPIPKWEPTTSLTPYPKLKTLVVDIETAGINPRENRIYAIGCMNEKWKISIFMDICESRILKQFLKLLERSKPDIVYTYNGTNFDLPFIIARCELHNIKHPFRLASKKRTIRTAEFRGKPLEIQEVFIQGCQHVDIFICVLRWDFVAKELTNGRSLKLAVLEMGLRFPKGSLRESQARLVLQYEEILACWKIGLGRGWGKIKKYLTYDLEDTALIAQRLVPSYHYEGLIVPKTNLQQRALGGNGWKWERIYEQHYPDYKPKPDRKYKFQGGIAYSRPGLYYRVAYIDFSSMYPKTILSKGIISRKDIDQIGLGVLQYLVDEKSSLESLAKGGDITAKDKIASTKVLANSQFGFFGTSQLPFNDMEAAALVTAYARRTLQFTIDIITSNGGIPIEVDTDGIFFTHPQPEKVHAILQSQLPKGLTIKLEFIAKAMFVPERGTKNYLLWLENSEIIRKGSWRSRSRSKFERKYPVDYLSYLIQNISIAENYHNYIKSQILSGDFLIKDLAITRRIREGEKELLKLGKPGDLVTYYQGITGVVSINSQEKYSRQYYLDLINQKREEILTIAMPEVLEKNKRQLSLF